jgi:dienelactone hydrolase
MYSRGVESTRAARRTLAVALFSWLAIAPAGCARATQAEPGASTPGAAPWLWGRLEPGPHGVGMEILAAADSGRPERSADGVVRARPLELVVWFPARAGGLTRSPITFAGYVDLSEGSMVEGLAATRPLEWRRRWLAEAVSRDPASVDPRLIDRLLASPMAAVRGATPLADRSPLMLWSTRHATPAAQSVMSEYLASHGYVVAWMRYAGDDSLRPPFDDVSAGRRVEILEAHVADMQWALRRLAAHPSVDSTRMGVAAWSYSGEPATALAQRAPRLRVLVSLSSSAFTWPYRRTDSAPSLDSMPLRTDVLVLEESGAARGRVREPPAILDRLPGKVFRVTFPELAHGSFNVLEGMIPGVAGIATVQPWSVAGPAAQAGYETISRAVRGLLDKTMKGAPGDGWATAVRHGPGRGVSSTRGTSFVDDTVVIEVDGWRLIGNAVRPAVATRGPAVLLLNKANGDRRVYAELARELAVRGVASLCLDLRGHGESTNRATFVPGLRNAASTGEDEDIAAALRWLRAQPYTDSTRVGVVGASYSGEAMMVAARAGSGARAYVASSPGSLSDRSIDDIDTAGAAWSIIVSTNERFLRGVVAAVRARSRTATVIEVDGTAHASDILVAHPELTVRVADWLRERLQ